ncbi:L-histidine N(alpha)-methyltransferase [Streptomyces violascens]|uniref:L-histidine N(alpha)-methyltransferase n=1 Tax=Streptomyces violascens TaxID=67381 RepID=UPI0037A1EEFF
MSDKIVIPTMAFYRLYSPQQVLDIIANLQRHHEIPRQYNYFSDGAGHWDQYTRQLCTENSPNIVNSTVRLLETNAGYIDRMLSRYQRVNVIDVGVGNALPTRGLLARLLRSGKLGRYVAVDISTEMLSVAEDNVRTWFADTVDFEGHVRDIMRDSLSDLLAEGDGQHGAGETANVVLLLGGTALNFPDPKDVYKAIHHSMGQHDIFLCTSRVDTAESRNTFSFSTGAEQRTLPPQYRCVLDLLGIDESCYAVESGFDDDKRERYLHIRLKEDLAIRFSLSGGDRVIYLAKGQRILLWRAVQQTDRETLRQLRDAGFSVHIASQTPEATYLLTIARTAKKLHLTQA